MLHLHEEMLKDKFTGKKKRLCYVSVLLKNAYTPNEDMCNFTFLLLTKSIAFVFQLNPAVMYRASDNSLPSALLQAISAYYQAKL